jgi:hypothetical protein
MIIRFKLFLTLCLALFALSTFGHLPQVHQAITVNAAESAFQDSPAFAGFEDAISSDLSFVDATNRMALGSDFEDNKVPPKDE